MKKLWDDYSSLIIIPTCPCGEKCKSFIAIHDLVQEQQIMQSLIGLNEAYKTIRGNILMIKPFPDIDEIYNLLLQEENQRGLQSTSHISPQAAAMHTQPPTSQVLSQPAS